MEDNSINTLGKKIFFLYPSALIQNQIVAELAQDEFEVYVVKDESKLRHVLKKYPDSVVFANISEGMKETEWENWIKHLQSSPETSSVDIGILTQLPDEALRKKYSGGFKLNCGYTVLRSDVEAVLKQLSDILNRVNAKGRRRYVRMLMEEASSATANIPLNGTFVNGKIKDISYAGFSCSFADDPKLTKNSLSSDIQLRLPPQLLKAEAIVFGSRKEGNDNIYVFIFTQRTSPDVRTKIRKYISLNLQSRMDKEL